MIMNHNKRLSRRDFLKSLYITVGTAVAGQALTACNLKTLLPGKTAGQVQPTLPSQAATVTPSNKVYFVRKNGDDTNGNGSSDAPWLTLTKAMTVAQGGDIVKVGDGLYEENSQGVGYWNINKPLTNWLTIEAEGGSTGDVRVQGASHATYNTLLRSGYFRFRYIHFTQREATNASAFSVFAGGDISNVAFEHCSFTITANGSTVSQGLMINHNDGWQASNFTFSECIFEVLEYKAGNHDGCRIGISGTDGSVKDFVFNNCSANGRYGLFMNGATDVLVNRGTYRGEYGAAICVGTDAESGGKHSTVTIRNATATSLAARSAGVLIGNGAINCLIDGLWVPECVDYALILKEHGSSGGGTEVKNCYLQGGSSGVLYCKAASYPNIHHNQLIGNKASQIGVFRMLGGTKGNKSDHVTFANNRVVAYSGLAIEWGDETQDQGGGLCDRNVYYLRGGKLGKIRGTAVSTLPEMQAAWGGYDVVGNDQSSLLITDEGGAPS